MESTSIGQIKNLPQWNMTETGDQESNSNFEIPKAWETAKKALQGVQQTKIESSTNVSSVASTNTTAQPQAGMYNYSYPNFYPMYGYSGYPNMTYPQYGYYNMGNYPAMYGNYYGHPQMPMNNENPIMATPAAETNNTTTVTSSAMDGQSVSETVNLLASQPPPPPPTPPPEEVKTDRFQNMTNKQAPGAGNIRFSLPKPKIQNKGNKFGGFQNMRGNKANYGEIRPNFMFGNRLSRPLSPPAQNTNTDQAQFSPKDKSKTIDFNNENYPPALKKYIDDAFNKCKTQLDKDQVEIVLKGKLSKVISDGNLWTKDWVKEPLPSIHSERLEKEAALEYIPLSMGSKNPLKRPRVSPLNRTFVPKPGKLPKPPMRSRSRSRSISPHARRVIHRKRYSDDSSSSSSSRDSPPRRRSPALYCTSEPSNTKWNNSENNNKWNTSENNNKWNASENNNKWNASENNSKFNGAESSDNKYSTPERNNKWNAADSKGKWGASDSSSNTWNNRSSSKKKTKKKKNKLQSVFSIEGEFGSDDRMQRRAARFEASGKKGNSLVLTINNTTPVDDPLNIDWSSYEVVGTCQTIEKPFLRLTTAVDPTKIRPVPILEKALEMVKTHWTEKQDYDFACDQLKSIRQDLVVQCIRDSFTIQVYETHARIAIEKCDHTEFNQCQSQLKVLHEELKQGNRQEFIGYHILYNIYINNTREIKNILEHLSPEDQQDEVIKHALTLNRAWAINNFHIFFKLYRVAPKMSGFIIDWFLQRERRTALKILVKSYRQTLPVAFVATELGFPSEKECLSFLEEAKCVLSSDRSSVLCKESVGSVTAEGC